MQNELYTERALMQIELYSERALVLNELYSEKALMKIEFCPGKALTQNELGQYIASARQGSEIRTLRLLVVCHRAPGVDYREWLVAGDARPQQSEYTQVCQQRGLPPATLREDSVDSDSTSGERD